MDVVTLQAAKAAAEKRFVTRGIKGLSLQGWASTPTDASSPVNAAIAACAARLATAGDGQMEVVIDAPGVLYGSFEMATGVSVRLGPKTMLAAMPGQSSSVIDYHSLDALQTVLSGGRIFGNYRNGATARCVDMTSSNSDAYSLVLPNQPSPQPDFPELDNTSNPLNFGGEWTCTYNILRDIFVYDCGGDIAVEIGRNQRGAQCHHVTVQNAKGVGYQIDATDSFHSGIDVGVCGDCILVRGIAAKVIGFKAWYAGRNNGYKTGSGDGIRVDIRDPNAPTTGTSYGEAILIGETNDNARYGWAFVDGHGHYARGTSCGDLTSMIYVGQDGTSGDVQQSDIEVVHSKADLTGPKCAVTLDTSSTYNTIVAVVDPNQVDATYKSIKVLNLGTLANTEVLVCHGMKKGLVDVGAQTGTYNPPIGFAETLAITANGALTIGPSTNKGYRREFSLRITTGASGSITWDASWGANAPYIPPSSTVTVTFVNTVTASDVPTWVLKSTTQPGITRGVLDISNGVETASAGTWAFLANGTAYAGAVRYNSSDAQNDSITFPLDLSVGTWSFAINGLQFSTAAIATVDISHDGGATWNSVGTVDFYTSGALAQKRAVLTGYAVPKTGSALIRFKSATRNGANTTHWLLEISELNYTRTGS